MLLSGLPGHPGLYLVPTGHAAPPYRTVPTPPRPPPGTARRTGP